jgi:hypothetical protein
MYDHNMTEIQWWQFCHCRTIIFYAGGPGHIWGSLYLFHLPLVYDLHFARILFFIGLYLIGNVSGLGLTL